jgi:tRNA(Ile)-lysidine synthetase-like protein
MVRFIVKDVRVNDVGQRSGELGASHVDSVLAFAESGQNGKTLELPGGVEVRRERDQLLFRGIDSRPGTRRGARKHATSGEKEFEHSIDLGKDEATIAVPCLARSFRFTKIDWPGKSEETSGNSSFLNHDALCKPLVLRNWRPGDTFQPLGHRKPHKLKRLLNEKRISRWDRDGWPVLTCAGVIAWVRGFPVGVAFVAGTKAREAVRIEECAISSH